MLLVENRDLLDRFRQGDRKALEEVYLAYARTVAAVLTGGFSFNSGGRHCRFHGTRSSFDLEDRLHDVFGRAFSESARLNYDGLTPYKTYLRTIARNLVIDDFRKKERALTEYSIEEVEAAPDLSEHNATDVLRGEAVPTGNPLQDAESAELVQLVADFKKTLGKREAEVYRLRFEDELEHKDIAEQTGLSASKIKTSEKRIRSTFFAFMKRHGYFVGYEQKEQGWLRALWSF